MVIDTFGQQAVVRALGVIERGAVAACCVFENMAVLRGREFAAEAFVAARQREGQCAHIALGRCAMEPTRLIHIAGHFSEPQIIERLMGLLLGNAKHHTLAAAAAQQCKHETGAFGRAAIDRAPHLQSAMPAVHARSAALFVLKFLLPNQRGIAEDP